MSGAALFGKLPAHGDFVCRGFDGQAQAAIDAWLSDSLIAAQERFADDWRDRFDRAAPWLFAGCDDAGWHAGAVSPSADKAGRRYPVYAVCAAPNGEAAESLAGDVLEVLYAAIGEGLDADDVLARLDRLGECAVGTGKADSPPELPRWWVTDLEGGIVSETNGARPPDLVSQMLALSPDGGDDAA
ncbi:type VI secretion system-associated protein TagF [Novosphingobium aquimarinum]|uniref:type VI secretion system-associated protein TagF n=1 Tax=Novosphingobium aquimarinum TaxID=2682494 RepID=UPI0018DC032F|nr:type VI secretion system-associated protein TagF [Novosphingobium aquimarinum]